MNLQVYTGRANVSALQAIVDALCPQATYGILENLTDIDFPLPKDEPVDVAKWPKGRIFCPEFELRWEQAESEYQVVFAGHNVPELPGGLNVQTLVFHSEKDKKYYCWNETNPRLGRTLEYRCIPGTGNVKLKIREYRDDRGRLVFWRYVEMKRENGQ